MLPTKHRRATCPNRVTCFCRFGTVGLVDAEDVLDPEYEESEYDEGDREVPAGPLITLQLRMEPVLWEDEVMATLVHRLGLDPHRPPGFSEWLRGGGCKGGRLGRRVWLCAVARVC